MQSKTAGMTRRKLQKEWRTEEFIAMKRRGRSIGLRNVAVDGEIAEIAMPAASVQRMKSCTRCQVEAKKAAVFM